MLQRIEDSLRDRATEARRRATPLRRVLGARSEHALVRHLIVESPDGALLAVQEGGRRDGPALLLLPGQANSYRWWTGLRETFERTHRTITFDYRGTGATVAPESDWSTTSFAEDAARVLRSLEVTRADVYATSMGGRVAQMLAVGSSDLVRRLVLATSSKTRSRSGSNASYGTSPSCLRSLARHGDPGAPTAHPQYACRVVAVRLRHYPVHSPCQPSMPPMHWPARPSAQARLKREPPASRIPQNRNASGLRL